MRRAAGIRGALIALILAAHAAAAQATPVQTSLRPIARPAASADPVVVPLVQSAMAVSGMIRSLRPVARPDDLADDTTPQKVKRMPKRGSVCRDRDLRGEVVGAVPGKLAGCGVRDAIRLRAVGDVILSRSAVMDCDTAKALKQWIEKGLRPAVGRYGGGLAGIQVAAGYSCRTRNNKPGGKISEHGKGRAIDISAIVLRNGDQISVLEDWSKRREGKILKQAHRAACGPFGTVLGPDADRYHRDHFHFDTARYRSGSYCR